MSRALTRLVLPLLFLLSPCLMAQTPESHETASAPQIQVPRVIRVSGTVSDPSGSASPSLETITFTLYQDQAGTTPLWSETQDVQVGVHGSYQVLLGADTPDGIPLSLFSTAEARWLGVQVAGQAEHPLVMFVSVPYALKAADAEALGGKPPSSYLTVDQLGAAPEKPASKAPAGTEKTLQGLEKVNMPITGEGMNRYLCRFTGPYTVTWSRIYETSSGDGIFTSTPRSALDVVGEITGDRFTLRDSATQDLWSWDMDVDPSDQMSRLRLLYFPPDPIYPEYPNGYSLVTVKGDHIGINNTHPRVQLDVNGYAAVAGRISLTQDTGTTTPTFGMDNVKNPNNGNKSTFRFYYQPGFNEWGTVLMGATSNSFGFFTDTPRRGVDIWGELVATPRLTLAQDTGTSSPTWHLDNTGSLFRLYHQPNINTSGTTVLTATLSGRVGIGVYEPTHTLDVAGSVAINGTGNALIFPDGTSMNTAPLPGPVYGVCYSNVPLQQVCSCQHLLTQTNVSAGGSCTVSSVAGACSATSGPTTFGACCVCA